MGFLKAVLDYLTGPPIHLPAPDPADLVPVSSEAIAANPLPPLRDLWKERNALPENLRRKDGAPKATPLE